MCLADVGLVSRSRAPVDRVTRGAGTGMAVDAARTDEGFTSAGAARVLRAACRTAGLDERGAELVL
ncbi:hypothetical protein GCM10010256_60840 [Streptomyces coeruleorubidus]|nr:hypothetical protein GCM10010256_60840 [Streptomyces coeruleorubidus]